MSFLELLFPKRCVSCGGLGSYICADCFVKIKTIETPICPVCTKPAVRGLTHPVCRGRYTLDGLVCLFCYTGPIRAAVKELKFGPLFDLVPDLLALLREEIEESELLYRFLVEKRPLVVPVPLHWFKERKRGFNQSFLLAQEIARRWRLTFAPGILKRTKWTAPQSKLSRKQREANVREAFRAEGKLSQAVLLVDDVFTTGATLRACGSVLKRAGARKVWGLTLVRKVPRFDRGEHGPAP